MRPEDIYSLDETILKAEKLVHLLEQANKLIRDLQPRFVPEDSIGKRYPGHRETN